MSGSNGLKSGKKTILHYIIIYYIYNRIAMVVNSMVFGDGHFVMCTLQKWVNLYFFVQKFGQFGKM